MSLDKLDVVMDVFGDWVVADLGFALRGWRGRVAPDASRASRSWVSSSGVMMPAAAMVRGVGLAGGYLFARGAASRRRSIAARIRRLGIEWLAEAAGPHF